MGRVLAPGAALFGGAADAEEAAERTRRRLERLIDTFRENTRHDVSAAASDPSKVGDVATTSPLSMSSIPASPPGLVSV